MKYFSKIFSLLALAGTLLTACSKIDNLHKLDSLQVYASGSAPVLTSSTNSVAPAVADSNNVAITFNWTNPQFATDSAHTKYVLQIDSAGHDFSHAYTREIVGARSSSFIAKEFNAALVAFGFRFGVTYSVDVRVIASYLNNNDQQVSNKVTLQVVPYVVPPKVQPPAGRALYLVGAATAGGWGNPVPVPAQRFTMIDTVTFEGDFYLGGGQYLMLPVNGSWDQKYAVADNSVPGLSAGGSFGYYSSASPTNFNANFPGPDEKGIYKIHVDFQNGKFSVTPVKIFGLLYVAGDYQGWNPASAPALASPNADGIYEGYVNVPSGGSYEFKLTNAPNWGGTNYGGAPGTLSTSGGNLVFPNGGGYYKINANTNDNTWSATQITNWGIIGGFTGWGSDANMTYDAGSNSWSANVTFASASEFKFRANSDWGLNLGDNGADGSLEQDGANLSLPAGSYTITLYLNNAGYYTYKIQ